VGSAPRSARARQAAGDPADAVAAVLAAKREVLLRVHRHRLQPEDLEDCLSQAALELVTRARDTGLEGERHIANALEQKFLSRVTDRQRALGGRSGIAAAAHRAVRLDAGADGADGGTVEIATDIGEPSGVAEGRDELRRLEEVVSDLTEDQRLVLACQVSLGMDSTEFCERYGWSAEKFRKVAQRARARLRSLIAEYELGDRCQRLESHVLAYAADATPAEEALTVRRHLANCPGCAALVRDLRIAGQRVAAMLPIPALATSGMAVKASVFAKLAGVWRGLAARFTETGGPDAAVSVTATAGTATAVTKVGVAMLCTAGLAAGGSWAVPNARPSIASRPEAATVVRATGPALSTPQSAPIRPSRTPTADRPRKRSYRAKRNATPVGRRIAKPNRPQQGPRASVPQSARAPSSAQAALAQPARPVAERPPAVTVGRSSNAAAEFGME
jgi:DNA-directed RNA polymerase specialized sigma24 family protein